jgi:hypothetical protein
VSNPDFSMAGEKQAGSAVINAGAFVLLYTLACLGLRLLVPFPTAPLISEKLSQYRADPEGFDVIFVGSSRVYHQIIPEQFDSAVAKSGRSLRSFNFGQDAMFPPESFYVLRQILQEPATRLRWVFIELFEIREDNKALQENQRSAQLTSWHDGYHTWLAIQNVFSKKDDLWDRVAATARHLRLWHTRFSLPGAGTQLLEDRLWPALAPVKSKGAAAKSSTRGFEPLFRQEQTTAERERHLRMLQERRQSSPTTPLEPLLERELKKIIALVRQAGAEPVFFLSPEVDNHSNYSTVPEKALLLHLNDVQRYPELHAPEVFTDRNHLNQKGATIYTDVLASRFMEIREGNPVSPR